jgi:hypothetical protein
VTRPDTNAELAADMADVAELFDAEFYASAYPKVATRTRDLLRHFCVHGWRELRKPNADFDVWWYWTNHLDPASDDVNPLVHYARIGQANGLSTRPSTTTTSTGAVLPSDRPVRRACLFAGFDGDSLVDESVLIYLRELSRFADVFCVFDNYLPSAELDKLRGVVTQAWAVRHGAYDFGSYSLLAHDLVGWERLSSYDEVLFVNDSCYLLEPLDKVFARMDAEACDWWGMQATKGLAMSRDAPSNQFTEPIPLAAVRQDLLSTYEDDPVYDFHVGSFFMAFRRPVLDDPVFRKLVDSVASQRSKLAIIQKYEIGLTHVLIGRGHAFTTVVPVLYPFHPMFTAWAFELIAQGLPLLKRYFLYQNHYDTPDLARWKERVQELVADAPVRIFEENLLRTAPADRLHRSFAIRADEDGTVQVPQVLQGAEFARRDKETAKRSDWWVFVVDPVTHALPENSRAVFDRVADDAEITKIILTRSRRVRLAGTNVVTEPLLSPEGRDHLLGAAVVFVADQPVPTLGVRAPRSLHHVIAVRRGLQLLKHGRTAGQPQHPGAQPPPTSGPLPMLHPPAKPQLTALLTASDVDQVTELSSQWPARYSDVWRTGIPAHDHLLTDDLPADLAAQEDRLRRELAGRRLVLFAPVARGVASGLAAPYPFSRAEVQHLTGWARENGAVIGVRETVGDLERPYSAAFDDAVLDLSPGRWPSGSTVLRSADVLLTDYDGVALDFTVTGRPVISFAHDLETAADRLLYDLDHLFPGPVCRDFDALAETLCGVFDPPAPAMARQLSRVRDLMTDHRDGQNAVRVVSRVREQLEGDHR